VGAWRGNDGGPRVEELIGSRKLQDLELDIAEFSFVNREGKSETPGSRFHTRQWARERRHQDTFESMELGLPSVGGYWISL